jgi:hypothetical protein
MSSSAKLSPGQAIDRAVCALFSALVADAKKEPPAFARARREFLALAAQVGPSFQHQLVSRAAERLVADLPTALPEDARRAVLHDCRRLFGRDLHWADLAAVDPWGSA